MRWERLVSPRELHPTSAFAGDTAVQVAVQIVSSGVVVLMNRIYRSLLALSTSCCPTTTCTSSSLLLRRHIEQYLLGTTNETARLHELKSDRKSTPMTTTKKGTKYTTREARSCYNRFE
jgi:hypothetical protein